MKSQVNILKGVKSRTKVPSRTAEIFHKRPSNIMLGVRCGFRKGKGKLDERGLPRSVKLIKKAPRRSADLHQQDSEKPFDPH
jgi:hypothetical protein